MASVLEALRFALDLQERGDQAAAETLFRRILDAVPGEPAAARCYASLLAGQGRFPQAASVADLSIAADPADAEGYLLLARIRQAQGRVAASAAAYRRALRLGAGGRELLFAYGFVSGVAGDADGFAEAVARACAGCREEGWFWKTPYYLAFDLIERKRRELSLEAMDRLLLPAADAAAGQGRADIRDWLIFLQGLLRHERGGLPAARPFYEQAEASVPMVRHFCDGAGFADRIAAVTPGMEAEYDATLRDHQGNRAGGAAILCACDAAYFHRFAPLFVMSVEAFGEPGGPASALHLHIVRPDAAVFATLDGLRARTSLRINLSWEDGGHGLSGIMARSHLTAVRFLRAPALASRYPEGMIVADIDGVFLGDPAAFLTSAPDDGGTPFDLGLVHGAGMLTYPYDGVAGGLLAARPTEAAMGYLRAVRRYLLHWLARGEMHYSLDQIAMLAALEHAGGALRIGLIGRDQGSWRLGAGVYRPVFGQKNEDAFLRAVRDTAAGYWNDPGRLDAGRRAEHRRRLSELIAPL
ncbi:tetratricopeptide repeat protein [Azospirillum sp. SYSU D00513]|uniref:tetratricopeptide repeat protein n=1 Tax=Azospirillum sp. SYSU D00513 TaxID=2812561 RepID=UPI001A96DD7B|nr:tetratricopeptide repeat protein [Azospirillum sp. SYSU D00513]